MIIYKDTSKMENPDEFGEALLEWAFPGGFRGFAVVNSSLQEIKPPLRVIRAILGKNNHDWYDKTDEARVRCFTSNDITIAWFWDADGILYVKEGDKEAINYDCKKDFGWAWVQA